MGGAAAGDFSEFAHSRWPHLVRLAYGLTCDRGLAEDLAQTALANAFASWSRVRRADDPDAYLRRILLNSHRGGFRKRRVTEQLGETQPDGVVSGKMVIRKRAAAVAALGVIAIAVTSTVAVLHGPGQRSAGPAARTAYQVTVNAPGIGPAGSRLIASGSIDGRRWQATGWVDPARGICFQTSGSSTSCEGGPGTKAPRESATGDPASLSSADIGPPGTVMGTVRADVTYLIVTLTNGQRLTLRPVAIFGQGNVRYVAFPVPTGGAVAMVTAFSGRAELGYAVPFAHNGSVQTVRWLKPGEPAPTRRARYLIGSGTLSGQPWSEYEYVGPWGFCLVTPTAATSCGAETAATNLTAGRAARMIFQSWGGGTGYVTVAATPAVSYVLVSRSDGSTTRIAPRVVSGEKFFVFASSPPVAVRNWAAYSAAGARLAAGTVP